MRSLFTLVLSCFSFVSFSQKYAVSEISPELLLNDPDKVTLLSLTHVDVKSKSKVDISHKRVTTIIEESLEYWGIEYSAEFQKITDIEVKIFNKLGHLVKEVKGEEIIDQAKLKEVSDSRIKLIPVNYGDLPYTIELSYIKKHNGILFYPDFDIQEPGEAILKTEFSIDVPNKVQIKYKAINTSIEPEIVQFDRVTKYIWTEENLASFRAELFSPDNRSLAPRVIITPKYFSIDGFDGSMENWKTFGGFMHRLNDGSQSLSPAIKVKVKSIVAKAKSDKEKIDLVYKYLQNNFRYVSIQLGIGGWKTLPASYVHENKYGDCKALSNYMMALLTEVGVESKPALVNRGNMDDLVFDDFASPSFNHVVLYIPAEDIFVECTSNYDPLGYMDQSTQGKRALVFDKEGSFLQTIPQTPFEDNVSSIIANVQFDNRMHVDIELEEKASGILQDNYRYYDFSKTDKEFRKWFNEKLEIKGGILQDLSISVSEDEPEVDLEYTVNSNRYCKKAGKRIFLPLNNVKNIDIGINAEQEERMYDLHNSWGHTENIEINYDLRDKFDMSEFEPYIVKIDSKFGTYNAETILQDDKLTYRRSFTLKEFHESKSEYASLVEFFKSIRLAEKKKISLIAKENFNKP